MRSSEARYRLMFESNPHPMWVYDVDTLRFLAVNDAAVSAYGFSRDEFLGMSIRDIRPAEEVARLESAVASVSPGLSRSGIWRHRRKDGTIFDVDATSHGLRDRGGRTRLVLALDITERLRAERELRSEHDRFEKLMEAVPLAICSLQLAPDGSITMPYASPRIMPIYGISPVDLARDATAVFAAIHPDDSKRVRASIAESAQGLTLWRDEFRVLSPELGEIWVEGCSAPIRLPDGSLLWHGYVNDVTARKQVNDALRASERRLRMALEAAGAIAFTWDVKNDAVTRYFSTEPALPLTADRIGTLNDVRARIHPDDLAAFDNRLAACVDAGTEYRNVYRVIRPDGTTAYLEEYGDFDRSSDGSAIFLTGMSIDITDRVAATEALRVSEARYRQLVDLLPTAIFVYADDEILYCNPAFLRMMGETRPEELIGSSPFDISHPSAHDAIRQRHEQMKQTGEAFPGFEKRIMRRDGRSVPVYSVAAAISGYGRPATLVTVTDLTERERALELLRSVLSSVGDAILTINEKGMVGSANQAAVQQFGYAEDELVGTNVNVLMPGPYRDEHDGYLTNYLHTGTAKVIGIGREVECLRRDGTQFPAELTVTEFSLEGERHFTGVLRDITERKRLQAQFTEAQKMEAVGRLAGGVAHDFNNLLTIINGYCELLMNSDFPVGNHWRESVAAIGDAGERAARLTQQLLAFSRKAVIEPKVIDLNEFVSNSTKLLRRLIGEDIIFSVITAPTPIRVKVDPGQLEQVIMNLAVNARDAMPTGGRLKIETTTIASADSELSLFACLSVSDTGYGMTDEVKGKIFEPFFTTKGIGKGTGLGLAVVHGVITQSGGKIAIESNVGVGTTFQVLLPLVTVPKSGATTDITQPATRGTETILLVEDEEAVRKIARISLQTQGYTVLEADGVTEAIRQAETHPGEIHLLVSDVVMPEMGGRQVLDAVRRYRPGIRVLFMSGYTDDAILLHGVIEANDAFIQKPFTAHGLARKVREVIDAPVS